MANDYIPTRSLLARKAIALSGIDDALSQTRALIVAATGLNVANGTPRDLDAMQAVLLATEERLASARTMLSVVKQAMEAAP
jgi:hypothetical protein